jgi:hypothetical protein
MGDTGPTLPFLLGAPEFFAARQRKLDIRELAALLYELQNVPKRNVRIANCYKLHVPVATIEYEGLPNVSELITLGKRKSSLYVSNEYSHDNNAQSVAYTFWPMIESAMTSGNFSHSGTGYGPYTEKDREYLRYCANVK